MTPNEIADTILGAMKPEAQKSWRFEVGTTALHIVPLTFWPTSLVTDLDISAVLSCFQDVAVPQRQVSWQRGSGHDPDSPRVVIQGSVKGKLVQATFVLKDAGG